MSLMPMNRNVKANRVYEDWAVTFLQSVLFEVLLNVIG